MSTLAFRDPKLSEFVAIWTTPLGFTYLQEPASYDESGPDPGDTHWTDDNEAELRWIPPPF